MTNSIIDQMKNFIRQITPPILLELGKILRSEYKSRLMPPSEVERISSLRADYNRRNTHSEANQMVVRDGLSLRIHPDSKCAFEPFCYSSPVSVEELDLFIDRTKEKKHLLDVGALHGIFSLVFAADHPSRDALAVDASPIAFARLLYNIHKNALSNIKPIECALSDVSGTLRMHYEWEHAVAADTNIANSTQRGLSVACETGDELCDSFKFVPDVIKVDVEGHEIKVIKGLWNTITRNRPLIFLELHPKQISQEGDSITQIVRLLKSHEYHAAATDGCGVSPEDIVRITENKRLVLTPS